MFRRKPQHRPAPPARLGRGERLGGINLLAGIIKRAYPAARHVRRVTIELPPPYTKRWTDGAGRRRVGRSRRPDPPGGGVPALRPAFKEFHSWQRAVEQHGHPRLAGHSAADLPRYRRALPKIGPSRKHITMAANFEQAAPIGGAVLQKSANKSINRRTARSRAAGARRRQ